MTQKISTLIQASFSLSPELKEQLLADLPNMTETQQEKLLKALEWLQEKERQDLEALSPEKKEELFRALLKSKKSKRQSRESKEHEREKKEAEKLLQMMEE